MLRHYFLTLHSLERFADLFIFPIVALVLWGFLAKYMQVQSFSLASFFMGGLILWVIFERVGTSVGIDFMWDVWERNIVNVLASPIRIREYIGGLVVVALSKVLVSFLGMAAIAAVFYGFRIFDLGLPLVAFWINIILFAVALGIFNISVIVRWGHSVGPLTWVIPFAIQPFAAVFYPVSVLPTTFQKIVYFLPLSHVFEGMRYTMTTNNFAANEFMVAFLLNLVYLLLAIGFFVYMFNQAKRKGSLVKL
ncbi:MAG: ABC transporter permease [Candidatus Curtissbacteria bacterium]|nr:ABC transporter permease [Candidatus Curtissbacteria bacterium]